MIEGRRIENKGAGSFLTPKIQWLLNGLRIRRYEAHDGEISGGQTYDVVLWRT